MSAADEEKETRLVWERKHPIQAEQERELLIYNEAFQKLLDPAGGKTMSSITPSMWTEAESSLKSLEVYLKEHKIQAERVRKTGIYTTVEAVLASIETLDMVGVDNSKVDVDTLQRVWGLVDKIGSGLMYLFGLDQKRNASAPVPTTRSVFLLKSAPPVSFHFSTSREEWREKQMLAFRMRLSDVMLDSNNPITREQEVRWSTAYRELERLKTMMRGELVGITSVSIKKTQIDKTIREICDRLAVLHGENGGDYNADFALMYISWELAMRIAAMFDKVDRGEEYGLDETDEEED